MTHHDPGPDAARTPASDTDGDTAGLTPATVTFYWRPGCPFCRSLAGGLQRAGVEFESVNIWEDANAAAFVRSVANGNEVVPTVAIGATSLVNPSPAEVVRLLESAIR
ncbi:MAG: glutaredoxin domain-containing protein [Ilumatobacteraceae bacterium]